MNYGSGSGSLDHHNYCLLYWKNSKQSMAITGKSVARGNKLHPKSFFVDTLLAVFIYYFFRNPSRIKGQIALDGKKTFFQQGHERRANSNLSVVHAKG